MFGHFQPYIPLCVYSVVWPEEYTGITYKTISEEAHILLGTHDPKPAS